MRIKIVALGWLVLTVAMAAATVITARATFAPKPVYQIREEWLMTAPTPAPEPLPETWTRYDVPLDDDLQRFIYDQCQIYGVDTPLVLAVIDAESDFQADMIGDYGKSYGLMQIHASQHTDRCIRLGTVRLLDPRQNVLTGIDYLAELIGWGHGVEYALSWYNGNGGALPWYYVDEVQARAEEIRETGVIVDK